VHAGLAAQMPIGDQSIVKACHTVRLAAIDEMRGKAARNLFDGQVYMAELPSKGTKASTMCADLSCPYMRCRERF
jgi:hypothetical protein